MVARRFNWNIGGAVMIMDAIYDRNILDIDTAKELRNKILTTGFNNLTVAEKTIYTAGLKGCLKHTDLNRIEINCKTLSDLFSLDLITKTTWMNGEFIKELDYERILNNVQSIRDCGYASPDTPVVPILPLNGYDKINDIERIIFDVYTIYNNNQENTAYMDNEIYIDEQIGVI